MSEKETPNVADSNAADLKAYLAEEGKFVAAKKKTTGAAKDVKDEFIDGTGYNKRALGWLGQLDRMSPENRQDVLRSLDKGRTDMGNAWAALETDDMLGDE